MSDLTDAMAAGDLLREAELRYEIIAEMLDPVRKLREHERPPTGTEIKALSIEADRLIQKIVALRAERNAATSKPGDSAEAKADQAKFGKVIEFDASRYRKQG